MQQSIHSKHQSILFKEDLLSHHGSKVRASSLHIPTFATSFSWEITRSPLFRTTSYFPDLNHFRLCTPRPSRTQNPIVSARKNRRRTGWQKTAKTAVQYVSFIASNLNVLPEPLGIVIREAFGVGHGGGSGIWKGFGGGRGFEGWGRRKWRFRLGLFRLLGICALVILLIISREPESDFACGLLGSFLLGSLVWGCQKAMKGWVVGFCSFALILIWGLRREHLHIRVQGLRVHSPFKIARARRR